MNTEPNPKNFELMEMAAHIVAAYVGKNAVSVDQLTGLLQSVYTTLSGIDAPAPVEATKPNPVVPIKKSVTPDEVTCLICGVKGKMLKRHLQTAHNLTPDEYRAQFNLPADYPMVAPNYASMRSEFAKTIGLGRKPGAKGKGKRPRKPSAVAAE